jgi:hypothetical protein
MRTPSIGIAAVLLAGCTVSQILIGQVYNVETPQAGACPALDWHFAVDAQRHIQGFLSPVAQAPTADLSGTLNQDDSFQMTATDRTTQRTAIVNGTFAAQVSTIAIHGESACAGQTFRLRLGPYFSRSGGGGGGGG